MAVVLMGMLMVMALGMVILVVGLSVCVSASAVVCYHNRSSYQQPSPNREWW